MNLKNEHARLLTNLELLQKLYGVSALSARLGITERTWCNRMKEPWKCFSFDDFLIIAAYCKVDFTALLSEKLTVR